MALLGNYNIFTKNPVQYTGGDSLSGIVGLRYNWNKSGTGRFYGENWIIGVADRCGVPNGYAAPYSWNLPPKSGGLGSNVGAIGSGVLVGSGALGVNIESTIEGLGEITNANLGLILSAVATLSGIGGLSADVLGALQASATLAGQGDFTASLGALAGAVATLSGTGTLTSDIIAKASLSADIYVNQSEASVQQIVDGVWNAVASQYNTSGTMGEAVQTGGSGGGATPAQIWSYSDRTLTESAGLSTEEHNKLFSLENSNGGGVSINYGVINSHTTQKVEELKEELAKIPKTDLSGIESKLNEIDSHNSLATEQIIDTIKEESNEVSSDVIRKTRELEESNVKTRNLVRQKTEKIDKNVSKLSDRQELTDKLIEDQAEEIESELERIYEQEADMLENEINTQFEKEAQEIENELNS